MTARHKAQCTALGRERVTTTRTSRGVSLVLLLCLVVLGLEGACATYIPGEIWNIVGSDPAVSAPLSRRGHACWQHNGFMYVFAGVDSEDTLDITFFNDMWKIEMVAKPTAASSLPWTEVKTQDSSSSATYGQSANGGPSGRYGFSIAELNGEIVFFGGYSPACIDYCRDVWHYNLAANTWTQKFAHSNQANLLESQYYLQTSILKNSAGEFCDTMNAQLNCTSAHYGPHKRWYQSTVAYNNAVYIFGGYSTEGSMFRNDMWMYKEETFNSTLEYRFTEIVHDCSSFTYGGVVPNVNTTNCTHDWPSVRRHHSAVVVGDVFYLFGGYKCCDTNTVPLAEPYYMNDLWMYSFLIGNWTLLTPTSPSVPYGRHGQGMFYWDQMDMLFLYGGYRSPDNLNGVSTASYLSDIWRYNITAQYWSEVTVSGGVSDGVTPLWESAGTLFVDTATPRGAIPYTALPQLSSKPTNYAYYYLFGGFNGTVFLDDIRVYDLFGCKGGCGSGTVGECYLNHCFCTAGRWGEACENDDCAATDTQTWNLMDYTTVRAQCTNNNGFCNMTSGLPVCDCKDGTTGEHCEVDWCMHNCTGRGACENAQCKCDTYDTYNLYKYCDWGNPSNKPDPWDGVGSCEDNRFAIWTGSVCEVGLCPNNCSSVGRCGADQVCTCMDGYSGVACHIENTYGSSDTDTHGFLKDLVPLIAACCMATFVCLLIGVFYMCWCGKRV